MVLKLTSKSDGKVLYVNSEQVKAWDAANDGVGTRLVFDADLAYEVKESPCEVKRKFHHSRGVKLDD